MKLPFLLTSALFSLCNGWELKQSFWGGPVNQKFWLACSNNQKLLLWQCSCFPLNYVIAFITCSTINRRNLPIHRTSQELLIHHTLSTQDHLRLEGQNLPGKKIRKSIFQVIWVIQELGFPREFHQTTSALCQQPVCNIWESLITLSLGLLSWNWEGCTDLQTWLDLAWWWLCSYFSSCSSANVYVVSLSAWESFPLWDTRLLRSRFLWAGWGMKAKCHFR